ncbi:MAG TPA: GAF and ANTAR domain-containing protein [Nocardioidaceae bacterium]|nr:GAF and ANTAR domain-containing protein [Nocardioidaceae bacterium]
MTDEPNLLQLSRSLAERLDPGDLDETLDRITAAAVELLPDVAYASITVRFRDGRLETVSPTDEALKILDEKQYALREGPCYDAASNRPQVISPDIEHDDRYPGYGPLAAEAGVAAQAAFRLFERNGTEGALNLYSARTGSFDNLDSVADLFRSQACVAIAYAHQITNLAEALETRTTIGKAMGIVMERYQLSDERAFAFLTRLSQHRNVKLRLVAEELVTESVRNVEAAHRSGADN